MCGASNCLFATDVPLRPLERPTPEVTEGFQRSYRCVDCMYDLTGSVIRIVELPAPLNPYARWRA